jgi:hypothetical protein
MIIHRTCSTPCRHIKHTHITIISISNGNIAFCCINVQAVFIWRNHHKWWWYYAILASNSCVYLTCSCKTRKGKFRIMGSSLTCRRQWTINRAYIHLEDMWKIILKVPNDVLMVWEDVPLYGWDMITVTWHVISMAQVAASDLATKWRFDHNRISIVIQITAQHLMHQVTQKLRR